MNREYSKGVNAAGLVLLTVQLLILLYKYIIVGKSGFGHIMIGVWAAVCGLLILVAMFIRKFHYGVDFILTVIGVMLWAFQIYDVFGKYPTDPVRAFILCSSGIFGIILIVLSLIIDMRVEKRIKKSESGH